MKNGKILVIDDEEIVCKGFERELGQAGYKVESALNAEEALKKVRSKKFDLIYIDYVLPGMDGVQVCREIKKISPQTEAVYMTGNYEQDSLQSEVEFLEAGGSTFSLYKPFSDGEILEVTKKALSKIL